MISFMSPSKCPSTKALPIDYLDITISAAPLGDLYVFDPVGLAWTDLSNAAVGTPPTPRYSHGFASVGGRLYVHGWNDGYGGERGSTGCEIQQTNTKSREGAADMRAHWHMHSHIPALKHTCTRTHENVRARERAGTQLFPSSLPHTHNLPSL